MMINKEKTAGCLKLSILIALTVIILSGCNDQPTVMGYNFLPDTISLYPINSFREKLITGNKSVYMPVPMWQIGNIVVGKAVGTEAISVIEFGGLPDTLSYLKAGNIITAQFVVKPLRYSIGDSLANRLKFNLYAIRKFIRPTMTWDTLFPQPGNSEFFDYSKVLGSFDGQVKLKDTMDEIPIDINKDYIAHWLAAAADTTVDTIGVALLPDDASTVIRQFAAQQIGFSKEHPFLRIYFTNKNNKLDTLILNSAVDASYIKPAADDPNYMTIQGTVSWRNRLYFDVSSLPPFAAIHVAKLELPVYYPGSYHGNFGMDSVFTAQLDTTTLVGETSWRFYSDTLRLTKDRITFPRVNPAVEIWALKGGKGSLDIRSYEGDDMFGKLDRTLLYGVNTADSTKRPKLTIIYSKRPSLPTGKK